jgi:hypothetical protein
MPTYMDIHDPRHCEGPREVNAGSPLGWIFDATRKPPAGALARRNQ